MEGGDGRRPLGRLQVGFQLPSPCPRQKTTLPSFVAKKRSKMLKKKREKKKPQATVLNDGVKWIPAMANRRSRSIETCSRSRDEMR